MKSSINLSVDPDIKTFAQNYSKNHDTSISKIVEDHFRDIKKQEAAASLKEGFVIKSKNGKKLFNCLDVDPNKDWRMERLEEKYLND